jgi:nucleotide-binding universal stress UspA family protein
MTRSPARSRIVVGVDGSAASDAAVRWAVREARLRNATVHLVSAYHSDSRLRAQYVPQAWATRQDERYAAAEALVTAAAELARRYLPPGQLIAELADELPARALLDRAAHAEMLVLGTTRPARQSGQPPRAMGPVARACLRLAHCPVVVVSPDDRAAWDTADRPGEQDAAEPPGGQGQSGIPGRQGQSGVPGRQDAGLRAPTAQRPSAKEALTR